MNPRIIVISGPTAAGKSELSLKVARLCNGEIINADSVQIYRGFDIGSGKLSSNEMNGIPHHLISTLDPAMPFNAGLFRKEALTLISAIIDRGSVPIISGGTGLYIRALLNGLIELSENLAECRELVGSRERELRAHGLDEAQVHQSLVDWLKELRQSTAGESTIPIDPARLRRALEIQLSEGMDIQEIQRLHRPAKDLSALIVALLPERANLYASIERRVDRMFQSGLLHEVEALLEQGMANTKPMESIGYREAAAHIRGELTLEQCTELIKRNTRHFAKRQYTWWRNQPDTLGWLRQCDIQSEQQLGGLLERFLNKDDLYQDDTIYFHPWFL